MPILGNIGVSYTAGKLSESTFHWKCANLRTLIACSMGVPAYASLSVWVCGTCIVHHFNGTDKNTLIGVKSHIGQGQIRIPNKDRSVTLCTEKREFMRF